MKLVVPRRRRRRVSMRMPGKPPASPPAATGGRGTAPAEGASRVPAQAVPLLTRPRILVVDDERDIREALAELLVEELGADVDQAGDGVEGLALAVHRNGYDLCFVDERMPRLRGSDLLRELRARGLTKKAILMSAYAEGSIGADIAKAAGAEEFVRKPVQLEELLRLAFLHLPPPGAPADGA